MAQRLKRLPAMWETWVQSLGWEDPLGKEMATHSSILAWRIAWTEEPGGLQSIGSQRVGLKWLSMNAHEAMNFFFFPTGLGLCYGVQAPGASLVTQRVKNLPAVQETQVQSLSQKIPWRSGQPTPVFLPGDSHGQRRLAGYSPWDCKESTTEGT